MGVVAAVDAIAESFGMALGLQEAEGWDFSPVAGVVVPACPIDEDLHVGLVVIVLHDVRHWQATDHFSVVDGVKDQCEVVLRVDGVSRVAIVVDHVDVIHLYGEG